MFENLRSTKFYVWYIGVTKNLVLGNICGKQSKCFKKKSKFIKFINTS